jgi:hypothetical protein
MTVLVVMTGIGAVSLVVAGLVAHPPSVSISGRMF